MCAKCGLQAAPVEFIDRVIESIVLAILEPERPQLADGVFFGALLERQDGVCVVAQGFLRVVLAVERA
jgi:hypothetical protein